MLQRAASNAYSWWWASHIRTKQSKWLEQSLQDMGEKVESVMKLIQEDGDSFAKRAEMYYKKRPELISFVEESFRAYQALAERYDHLSKELQNANSTLASAFPDQFQYPMDDDDDDGPPRVYKRFQEKHNPNIPKAPSKFPAKNIKAFMALTAKSNNNNDPIKKAHKTAANAKKSGFTKSQAINEVDKLQKQILTLQTEKEFAKSSYEKGYAKYWEIEEQIPEMQEKISKLQDEFGITQVIEDEEARTLMAEAALKSCQETLTQLQEKQEKAAAEAKAERQRIKDAREKFMSLKGEVLRTQGNQTGDSEKGNHSEVEENWTSLDDEVDSSKDSKELEKLRDKIKEHFDVGPMASLSVSEMAEKIDELVNKVINLETAVSSQNAMIHRLRSETNELHSQIKTLENDKSSLIDGKNTLNDKLVNMEKKLKGLQDLNSNFEKENSSLETHFTEARSNLDTISEKLHNVKPDEEVQTSSNFKESGSLKATVDVDEQMVQKGDHTNTLNLSQDAKRQGKSAELEANASASSKKESVELKSNASASSEKEYTELMSNVSIPSEKESIDKSNASTPSKKETVESESIASAPAKKDDAKQKKQPKHKKSKSTDSDIAQSQSTSNKQEVEPVKSYEPANLIRDELVTSQDAQPKESTNRLKEDPEIAPRVYTSKQEDEPDWQQLYMNKLEGKEKVLLEEYTSTLRNYKEAKKKLGEMEKKTQDDISQILAQLKDLKSSNAKKDEELYCLRQKISTLQKRLDECRKQVKDMEPPIRKEEPPTPAEDEDDIKIINPDEGREISPLEEKLRADIDEILEENLDFWMRFSSSFAQIQKFQNVVKDLRADVVKLERYDEKKEGSGHGSAHGSPHMDPAMKSDARPIYKHLRETQTELTVWIEQAEKLKDELQSRFSQLCNIEHDIKRALDAGAADEEMKFTSFQAAKFQGEVANMQQENHKVADELQAGMDHINSLQLEVERTVARLDEELGFSGTQNQDDTQIRSGSQNRVPLRSFIFGVKPQKKKQSIFSCMHPAMMHRRYQHLKTDKSL